MKLRTLPAVTDRTKTTNAPLTFAGGVNNTAPEQQTLRDEIVSGVNMWLDRTGGAYNRNGSTIYGNVMGVTTGVLGLFNFIKNDGATEALLAVYDTVIKYYSSGTWTDISGITLTTNKKAEGAFYSETNKFYVTNATDNVGVITTTGSATTDANFKKGIWIEPFDGRLTTGGVTGSENRYWVTDLGVDTFTSTNWIDLEGKLLNAKTINQKLQLIWSDRKLYKVPGLSSTPNAAGPEAVFEIADIRLVGTRAVTVMGSSQKVAYFIALDSENVADVYACDGQAVVPLGSPRIKDYLNGLAAGQLANICMINDGRFVRFAAAPSGATTNTREYIFDTVRKVWMPEFRPQFPISCYAFFKVSSAGTIFAGNQSIGMVQRLGHQRYDELVDQSYTAGNDADQNIAGATTTRASQGFKLSHVAGNTRYVTGGAVLMKKNTGTTTELTVRIETDSSSKPSGTLADSNLTTTIAAFTDTAAYAWRTFTFSTPALLTAQTQYHLVIQHTTEGSGSSEYHLAVDSSSPSYANGALSTYASSAWTAVSGSDALFMLFVEEHVEGYIAQTTDCDERLYPKSTQHVLIEGQSSTGITSKFGVGVEGKDSIFEEVDVLLSGKSNVWASSSTDTTSNRLIWAVDENEAGTSNKWASDVDNYSVSVFVSPYIPTARYITYRHYFKGIGDFRINSYVPYFEVIQSTI